MKIAANETRPRRDCPKNCHLRRDKFQNFVREETRPRVSVPLVSRPRRDRDSRPSLPPTHLSYRLLALVHHLYHLLAPVVVHILNEVVRKIPHHILKARNMPIVSISNMHRLKCILARALDMKPHIFWTQIFLVNFYWTQKFGMRGKLFFKKCFSAPFFVGLFIFNLESCVATNLSLQKFCKSQHFSWAKYFLAPNFFLTQKLWNKICFDPLLFWT